MRSISKWNKGHLTWAIQWEPFQRLRATRVEATSRSPSVDPFGTAGPASVLFLNFFEMALVVLANVLGMACPPGPQISEPLSAN